MCEIYKKQHGLSSTVLGEYGEFKTTKMAFADNFKNVELASGKMSQGMPKKFLYKTSVKFHYEVLLEIVEALGKCSTSAGSVNYHEIHESTNRKGEPTKLVLKNSEYGGLMLCYMTSESVPDSFPSDDDEEDPVPSTTIGSVPEKQEWSQSFEKFFISKHENWRQLGQKLREYYLTLEDYWTETQPAPKPPTPPTTPTTSVMSETSSKRKSVVEGKVVGEKKKRLSKKKSVVLDSDNEVSSWALATYRAELEKNDDYNSCEARGLCDVLSIMLSRKQTLAYTLKHNYRELIVKNDFPYNKFLDQQDVINETVTQLRKIDAFHLQSCSDLKKKLMLPL
jgi:hypothetical protein